MFLERNREQVITISYKKINNLSNIIIECFYEYCDYIIEKSYIDQLKKLLKKIIIILIGNHMKLN